MSLINDALRRTKQVQQQAPPVVAPGPPLQLPGNLFPPAPGRGFGGAGFALRARIACAVPDFAGGSRPSRVAALSAALARRARVERSASRHSPTSTGYHAPARSRYPPGNRRWWAPISTFPRGGNRVSDEVAPLLEHRDHPRAGFSHQRPGGGRP